MEGTAARQRAVAAIRARVLGVGTGSWFSDAEHVQLAIASAMGVASELVPVLFSGAVQTTARPHAAALAITEDEWKALFGADVRPFRESNVTKCAARPACADVLARLERALRCTTSEASEGRAWQSMWSRLAVYIALHTTSPQPLIASTLGNFVGGDSRRLEELAVELDDEGVDTLMLAEVLDCMSRTVA